MGVIIKHNKKKKELKNFEYIDVENNGSGGVEFLQTITDSAVYIYFIGTSGGEGAKEDWKTNLKASSEKLSDGRKAHKGFFEYAKRAYPRIREILGENDKKRVVFIGSSQGGAIATIVAYLAQKEGYIISRLEAFCSARAGNKKLYEYVKKRIPFIYHIVCNIDLVVGIPFWFYQWKRRYTRVQKRGGFWSRFAFVTNHLYVNELSKQRLIDIDEGLTEDKKKGTK